MWQPVKPSSYNPLQWQPVRQAANFIKQAPALAFKDIFLAKPAGGDIESPNTPINPTMRVDINNGKPSTPVPVKPEQYKAALTKPVAPIPAPKTTPTPTPVQKKEPVVPTNNPWTTFGRPAVNPHFDTIKKIFGDVAEDINRVLRWGTPDNNGYGNNYGGENLSFDATQRNKNKDGSIDIGLFQINSNTFKDFLRRKPDKMKAAGISSFEQLIDPTLNTKMAKIIYDEQGFKAWYGRPRDL